MLLRKIESDGEVLVSSGEASLSSAGTYSCEPGIRPGSARKAWNEDDGFRFMLESIGRVLPQGLLFLTSELELVYANAQAAELLDWWARSTRESHAGGFNRLPRLPKEIANACLRIQQERADAGSLAVGRQRPNHGRKRHVWCPNRLSLSAVVSFCRDRGSGSGFCILLEERPEDGAAQAGCPAPAVSNWRALLTPAERRVAALIAEGRSNVEIARAVGRELSTIKAQLSSIYAKLAVPSRTQLAVLLLGQNRARSL